MNVGVVEPPVLTINDAARYVGRSVKAMYRLREKRTGPPSFRSAGRVLYRREQLDAWLAEAEAADSRSNLGLDPTRRATEARTTHHTSRKG